MAEDEEKESDKGIVNLIPEFFYDLLARIIPSIILVFSITYYDHDIREKTGLFALVGPASPPAPAPSPTPAGPVASVSFAITAAFGGAVHSTSQIGHEVASAPSTAHGKEEEEAKTSKPEENPYGFIKYVFVIAIIYAVSLLLASAGSLIDFFIWAWNSYLISDAKKNAAKHGEINIHRLTDQSTLWETTWSVRSSNNKAYTILIKRYAEYACVAHVFVGYLIFILWMHFRDPIVSEKLGYQWGTALGLFLAVCVIHRYFIWAQEVCFYNNIKVKKNNERPVAKAKAGRLGTYVI